MGKTLLFLGLLLSVLLLGCSRFTSAPAAEFESRGISEQKAVEEIREEFGLAVPPEAPLMEEFISPQSNAMADDASMDRGAVAEGAFSSNVAPADGSGTTGGNSTLQLAQRQVISTATISIEVEKVQVASAEVRGIAESLGGFVEQLSSSGGANNQQANITIRVPQGQFSTAVERLMALGEVQNQNQGSEDVSERFIDLKARLKSAEREEQSLLSLLERTLKVNEILTVERELNRVRSEIERLQGQLNFLERRVDLATISVFLFTPTVAMPQPPSGSLAIQSVDVTSRLAELRSQVSSVGGKIDRVFLSEQGAGERAEVTLRVFPEDFTETVEYLGGLGVVLSKELREGSSVDGTEQHRPEEPNARIELTLAMPQPPSGSLVIEAADVTSRLIELRSKVSSLEGKIDREFLTERKERERAVITFRVFPEDFTETVEFLESLGVVQSKELRESSPAEDSDEHRPEEPNARIEVTLEEKQGTNTGLILGITVPTGLFLAGLLGLVGYLAYRAGRRRASSA